MERPVSLCTHILKLLLWVILGGVLSMQVLVQLVYACVIAIFH